MLKVLDKEGAYIIVKMDIYTYDRVKSIDKLGFNDLIENARKSKAYDSHDELMSDLMS